MLSRCPWLDLARKNNTEKIQNSIDLIKTDKFSYPDINGKLFHHNVGMLPCKETCFCKINNKGGFSPFSIESSIAEQIYDIEYYHILDLFFTRFASDSNIVFVLF